MVTCSEESLNQAYMPGSSLSTRSRKPCTMPAGKAGGGGRGHQLHTIPAGKAGGGGGAGQQAGQGAGHQGSGQGMAGQGRAGWSRRGHEGFSKQPLCDPVIGQDVGLSVAQTSQQARALREVPTW